MIDNRELLPYKPNPEGFIIQQDTKSPHARSKVTTGARQIRTLIQGAGTRLEDLLQLVACQWSTIRKAATYYGYNWSIFKDGCIRRGISPDDDGSMI